MMIPYSVDRIISVLILNSKKYHVGSCTFECITKEQIKKHNGI